MRTHSIPAVQGVSRSSRPATTIQKQVTSKQHVLLLAYLPSYTQEAVEGVHSTTSDGANQLVISALADSGPSEAWMMLRPVTADGDGR